MNGGGIEEFGRQVCYRVRAGNWGVVFRLLYLVFVITITVPIIFYALAAYEFQVDSAEIAEGKELSAGELISRAATWRPHIHQWAELVHAGADVPEPSISGQAQGAETEAQKTTEAKVLQTYWDAVAALRTNKSPAGKEGDDVALLLASELHRFDRLSLPSWLPWYGRPSALAEMPVWALTLVVTLVAGLLGSLIFVLKAMLRQLLDNWSSGTKSQSLPHPWSWLLLRPIFGVVIALGAYVALQSGLLVVDGAMSLSPSAYVTATVGLIAGLLSWHVIDTIEDLGERWLKSHRPLWGYGLKSWVEADDKTLANLAQSLGVSEGVMKDWINVRAPVPQDSAKRLAAEFNVHLDQLFQPVPPWRRSNYTSGD